MRVVVIGSSHTKILANKRTLIKENIQNRTFRIHRLKGNQINRRSEQAEGATSGDVIPNAIGQRMTGKEHQAVD